jgi:hypothetical protein
LEEPNSLPELEEHDFLIKKEKKEIELSTKRTKFETIRK